MQNAQVLNQEILINPELYHPWTKPKLGTYTIRAITQISI